MIFNYYFWILSFHVTFECIKPPRNISLKSLWLRNLLDLSYLSLYMDTVCLSLSAFLYLSLLVFAYIWIKLALLVLIGPYWSLLVLPRYLAAT